MPCSVLFFLLCDSQGFIKKKELCFRDRLCEGLTVNLGTAFSFAIDLECDLG